MNRDKTKENVLIRSFVPLPIFIYIFSQHLVLAPQVQLRRKVYSPVEGSFDKDLDEVDDDTVTALLMIHLE